MKKSVLAMALVGSVVVGVGGVLAAPHFRAKPPAPPADLPQLPPTPKNALTPTRPLEAPEGFRRWDNEAKPARIEAPFKLTASDGTGLVLAKLDARAVLDGPLAFTELRMTFDNPENRILLTSVADHLDTTARPPLERPVNLAAVPSPSL